ncbi:MAG TPA: hypothetical protein PKC39_10685 [Ferruginibacter sp.]|nr:hypothetical protein [Ferruginibacter sp.]HMP21414.1 hypothetical protein [Ferruginibacter sp.]
MKKQSGLFALTLLSAVLILSACKKDNNSGEMAAETEIKAQADDQERFAAETDEAATDAFTALENSNSSLLGRPLGNLLPVRCDASIDIDTVSAAKKITITYNGNCLGNRTRTGSIVLSFANSFRWGQAGATFTLTYNNLTITRVRDNKKIIINGVKTVTNVSGGFLRDLATATAPRIHDIKSNGLSITFDNGTSRVWRLAKRRTFTYDNGIVMAVSGISTEADGVAEWGINRFGGNFTTTILSPLTIKQSCNYKLVSGAVKLQVNNRTTTTTFGLDAMGLPVSACVAQFYLKIEWVGPNGGTLTYLGTY